MGGINVEKWLGMDNRRDVMMGDLTTRGISPELEPVGNAVETRT